MSNAGPKRRHEHWRSRIHKIIFEHDPRAGKAFDIALPYCILLSVLAVALESVASIRQEHGDLLRIAEWAFTILFSVEYVLRLITVQRPLGYATSFFGIVDLAAIAPTFLSVLLPGAQSLLIIRALRLLRVFRVLKLGEYVGEARLPVGRLKWQRDRNRNQMAESTKELYKAEYLGSGTFSITKPKRKAKKLKQAKAKMPQRRARK